MNDDLIANVIGPLPFPSFFTVPELADLLKVEVGEARRMVRAHEIAAFWVGGEYRILTKDLIAWLILQRSTGGNRNEQMR
jgi:excisionase family DNA binding protein